MEKTLEKKNLNELEWVQRVSPKEKFEVFRKELSVALGCPRHVGTWGGGHPYDVELCRLAPGKTNWPQHAHCAQYEFYIIHSGRGISSHDDEKSPIQAGDFFIIPPKVAHNMTNTGDEDLVYTIIADNQPADVVSYPATGNVFIKPNMKSYRLQETDYYEGQE